MTGSMSQWEKGSCQQEYWRSKYWADLLVVTFSFISDSIDILDACTQPNLGYQVTGHHPYICKIIK